MPVSISSQCCGQKGEAGLCPPTDVVLVLDRSGSMTPDRLPYMKQGAHRAVDLLCGSRDLRLGLVTYAAAPRLDVPLTRQAGELHRAIRSIAARGCTRHAPALQLAGTLFDDPGRRKVVLLFTDGGTTGPEDPLQAVFALKKQGVELFCLGLGPCLPPLEQWVSDPTESHLAVTDHPCRLPDLFAALVEPLACREPGCPALPEVCPPPPECLGCGCSRPVRPQPCPDSAGFRISCCRETTVVDLPDHCLSGLGRMIYLNVTLKAICPNKRLAVAVQLLEVDRCGREHPCGLRFFEIPAQGGTVCRDLKLNCIRFVVPEGGCCSSLCRSRCFRAKVMANYLDTDLVDCCTAADL